MAPVAMCEWKSAGICTLAAKVRWYEDDLKSLQRMALRGRGSLEGREREVPWGYLGD